MKNYAIVQTSGKQFLLKPERWYDVDYIQSGNVGDCVTLNKILLFKKKKQIQLGKPFLNESKIAATILGNVKGEKITVLKTKPKKKYTRTRGHRTLFTRIKINQA